MKMRAKARYGVVAALILVMGCVQALSSNNPQRGCEAAVSFSVGIKKPLISQQDKKMSSLGVYEVQPGDTLIGLFGDNWRLVARINRVSPRLLMPGMKLLVPLHLESAGIAYCPLPGNISRDVDLLIGLKEQALGRYEKGILQAWYPIASGKEGYATPTGSFRILQKERVYRSRTYPKPDGGALMPHAMRFYKGYWIHGGALPGKPASHGCIRLMPADAQVLYKQSQKGDLILIKKKLGP